MAVHVPESGIRPARQPVPAPVNTVFWRWVAEIFEEGLLVALIFLAALPVTVLFIVAQFGWFWAMLLAGISGVVGIELWETQPLISRICLGIAACIVIAPALLAIPVLLFYLNAALQL